jgi:thioredoxin 1
MEGDELNEIRARKMRELMDKFGSGPEEKTAEASEKAPDTPVEITDASFGEFVSNHQVAVVDCWAPWCAPCRMIAPMLKSLAKHYAGRVAFGKLNVDENPRTPGQYEIMGIPTLLIFKNGKLADKIVGVMPMEALRSRIDSHL